MGELDRFASFAERFLALDSGAPFRLEQFQRWLLAPYFEGVPESVLSTPKGCGKSTLLGALTLYELLHSPEAEIVVAAAARDQASVLLGQAQAFVRRSPALARRLRMTGREIRHEALLGRARVISSDVATGDGLIPTHVFCDELHRWKDGELFDTLRVALSKRRGRMLTISTAGVREESPLWPLRERALSYRTSRKSVRLEADGRGFALRELSAPEDASWRDLDMAALVNPLTSRDALELRFDGNETAWRRFTLNQWVERAEVDAVIPADRWREGATDRHASPPGPLCFAIDAAPDRSSAAIAVAYRSGDGFHVELVEAGAGVQWLLDRVIGLRARHPDVLPVVVDSAGPAATIAPRIEEHGFSVKLTTAREFARACQGFYDHVVEGRLSHRDEPPLSVAVAGATKRSLVDGWAFSRSKSVADISPLCAAALAVWGVQELGPITRDALETLLYGAP